MEMLDMLRTKPNIHSHNDKIGRDSNRVAHEMAKLYKINDSGILFGSPLTHDLAQLLQMHCNAA
jgi:hypothetical protein